MSMFATHDQAFTISTNRCDHCKEVIAVLSFSRQVVKSLNIWQHSNMVLHKGEAEQFSQSITEAITLAELEQGM